MNLAKLQSAMEYLMTYGWAILVIAVALGVLYQLGVFGNATSALQPSCLASTGFYCSTPIMNTTGYLGTVFGEIGINRMTITNVACTANVSSPTSTQSMSTVLVSGSRTPIAFLCPISSNSIGTTFKGYLWITYDRDIQSGMVDRFAIVTGKIETTANVLTAVQAAGGSTGGGTTTTSTSTTTTTVPVGGATYAIGQASFTQNASGTAQNALYLGYGAAAYDNSGNLWIIDDSNNRILEYPPANQVTGGLASVVIGQPDFGSGGSGTTQNTLSDPQGLVFDSSGDLWVADYGNSRVLEYLPANLVTGGSASLVLGQSDFISGGSGVAQNSFSSPQGVTFDSNGDLWVSDYTGERVLEFLPANLVMNGDASLVIGQPDFISSSSGTTQNTMAGPYGMAVGTDGTLWIAEYDNNRVVGYQSSNLVMGGYASYVIGQPNFDSSSYVTTTPNSLYQPSGIVFSATGNMLISDYAESRVLEYVPTNQVTNGYASFVFGQPDLVSSACTTTQTGMCNPGPMDIYGTTLAVPDDSNNRILIFKNVR